MSNLGVLLESRTLGDLTSQLDQSRPMNLTRSRSQAAAQASSSHLLSRSCLTNPPIEFLFIFRRPWPVSVGMHDRNVDCVADSRYAFSVTVARDLASSSELEPADLAWLIARLDEYRDLLEYLREH